MSKTASLLFATTAMLVASASAFGAPQITTAAPDASYSVFFNPGAASLSKEGLEIISVVAKRFTATQSTHSTAHILMTSETDQQDSAALSNERINAVGSQLIRDGVPKRFVSADERVSNHSQPVNLQEGLDRRVSISIQDSLVLGRL